MANVLAQRQLWQISHYHFSKQDTGGFHSGNGDDFASLDALLQHYESHPHQLSTELRRMVPPNHPGASRDL